MNDGKLNHHAKKCVFLSYKDGIKGYRLWDPSASTVITSRDVTFNESLLLHYKSSIKGVATVVMERDSKDDTHTKVVDDDFDND